MNLSSTLVVLRLLFIYDLAWLTSVSPFTISHIVALGDGEDPGTSKPVKRPRIRRSFHNLKGNVQLENSHVLFECSLRHSTTHRCCSNTLTAMKYYIY